MNETREEKIVELIKAVVFLTNHGKQFCVDYGYENAVEVAEKISSKESPQSCFYSYCGGNHENLSCIID